MKRSICIFLSLLFVLSGLCMLGLTASACNDGRCDRTGCGVMMTCGDHCPRCGKIHNGGLFDRITGFFHRIFYVISRLFVIA